MGFEEYFSPPFSVFFLWAIFLAIIILFHPIRAVIKKICQCFGCSLCADAEVEEGDDERGSEGDHHGDYWGHLSADRKLEIDNLRALAILKYLAKFTLTLKDENMTTRESTERAVVVESVHESTCTEDNNNDSAAESNEKDLEKGFPNEEELDLPREAKVETMECTGEYTHILVPLPGHGIADQEIKTETSEPAKTSWHSSLSKLKAPQAKPNNNEATAENKESNVIERAVPIFCAVCLMEYEVPDRVCWSSNRECTHVFHEDCIVQWLVSSGRTKSKRRWFPDSPSERRIMCYELECPCCRQEFVSKETRSESAEENV